MARAQVSPTERAAFVGRTGAGKSFLARYLLSGVQRLVAFDPKGTLGLEENQWNLTTWNNQGEKDLLDGKPVRLRIPAPLDRDWSPYLSACYHAHNVLVYIDEMYGVVPKGARTPDMLNALYTRGRELKIGVWAATQRPAWVPLEMFTEAEWFFLFRVQMDKDRERMAELMGDEVLTQKKDMHGFWSYNVMWDKPRYHTRLVV